MIKLENVLKEFGSQAVLDGVNLEIKEGELVVIVGPSGTGKSVTLKHILGLMQPDSGDVFIAGKNIKSLNKKEAEKMRSMFGVLFQSGALINWLSIGDNIALPLFEKTKMRDDEIQSRVKEVLSLVAMEGAEEKKPSEVSGGMKKRAGLARAIVLNPKILLYDEPTSGLDPLLSRKIDELIKDLSVKLKVTSIVVTHDMVSAFSIADRIVMLHKGKIIEDGAPEKFRNSSNPIVKNFVDAQFGYQS
ncbi:MAG: ABC transporter ATP-binding protein [Lentisphaeria bacterium]